MQAITPGPRLQVEFMKKKNQTSSQARREGPLSLKTKPRFKGNEENICLVS